MIIYIYIYIMKWYFIIHVHCNWVLIIFIAKTVIYKFDCKRAVCIYTYTSTQQSNPNNIVWLVWNKYWQSKQYIHNLGTLCGEGVQFFVRFFVWDGRYTQTKMLAVANHNPEQPRKMCKYFVRHLAWQSTELKEK